MEYTLSIEEATLAWKRFIKTREYADGVRLLQQAIKELEGEKYIDPSFVLGPIWRDYVFDTLLGISPFDERFFTRDKTISDAAGFLKAYLRTPLAAFLVLTMARPMKLFVHVTATNIRHYSAQELYDIHIPAYLKEKLVTPYKYAPQRAFENWFTCQLFLRPEALFSWDTILLNLDYKLKSAAEDAKKRERYDEYCYYTAMADSFSLRGHTQGQPKASHNCIERPNQYSKDPINDDTKRQIHEAATYLGRLYRGRLQYHKEILEHQSTTPIDSAIGNWLYEPNSDTKTRVESMVMLGLLGDKYHKPDQVKYIRQRFKETAVRAGYDDFSITRTSGQRVMLKGGKPEWVNDATEPFTSCPFDTYTVGVIFRLRLIWAESQWIKSLFKRPADILKNLSFKLSDWASTDAALVEKKLTLIGQRCYREGLFAYIEKEGDYACLCATDAHGWDRTISFSVMETAYTLLREAVPDLDANNYQDLLAECDTIIPERLQIRTNVQAFRTGKKIVASGESYVTAKNNAVHSSLYFAALRWASGLTFEQIRHKLESHEWILCIHGDDLCRYLGPNKDLYFKVDEFLTKCGIDIGYEKVPVFLKRFVSPFGELTADWGSGIKNFVGEYPKAFQVVTEVGALARLKRSIAVHERHMWQPVYDAYCDICGIPRVVPGAIEAQEMKASERLQKVALKLGERATMFRHDLETLFYTNYEQMPNQILDTIYGGLKIDYVKSEFAQMYTSWSLEQLVDAICTKQQQIFSKYRE